MLDVSVDPFPVMFTVEGTNRPLFEGTNRCDENPNHCFEYCVSPTVCNKNFLADCITHPERYAVIPFSGAIDDKLPKQATWHCLGMAGAKIKWEVCCGCGEPTSGPPPDDKCKGLENLKERRDQACEELKEWNDKCVEHLSENYEWCKENPSGGDASSALGSLDRVCNNLKREYEEKSAECSDKGRGSFRQ